MSFLSNSSKPIDEADVDGTSEATCLGAIIFRLVVEGFLGCGAEIAMRADADLCFQRPAWIEIPCAPPHKGVVKCGYVVILVRTSCPERHLLITDEAAERKVAPFVVGIAGRNTREIPAQAEFCGGLKTAIRPWVALIEHRHPCFAHEREFPSDGLLIAHPTQHPNFGSKLRLRWVGTGGEMRGANEAAQCIEQIDDEIT